MMSLAGALCFADTLLDGDGAGGHRSLVYTELIQFLMGTPAFLGNNAHRFISCSVSSHFLFNRQNSRDAECHRHDVPQRCSNEWTPSKFL